MKRIVLLSLVALASACVAFVWLWKGKERPAGGPAATASSVAGASAPSRPRVPGGDTGAEGELHVLADDDREGTLRLEGIVLDVHEAPVAGAVVTVSTNPPRSAVTGEDGTFAFDKLLGRVYQLVARAPGGVAGPVSARLTERSDPVTLRLGPAATVEVAVVSADDRSPVAGASVELRDLATLAATTGADGRATFDGVGPGRWEIVAWAPGYAKAFGQIGVARPAAGVRVVEKTTVALRRGAPVSGVVRGADGRSVEGALVLFLGASSFGPRPDARRDAVRTDAEGRFRFDALPAGSFRFAARHPSYAPGSSPIVTLDGQTERRGVEIVLEAGAVLAGRVVSRSGEPIAQAAVRVAPDDSAAAWRDEVRQTFTDETGAFEMTGLPRRRLRVVALSERGSSPMTEVDLEGAASRRDLVLTLELEGAIAGIVVDDKGEPVSEAQVVAVPDFRRLREGRFDWRLRGLLRERADAGGRFEFRGLEDGTYRITASRTENPRPAFGRMGGGVTAKVGDTDVRVVVETGGRLKGKVLYADGSAPDLYVVGIGFGGGTPFSASDGAFILEDVAPGERTLTVSGPGFDRVQVAVRVVPDQEVDVGTITVKRGRTISGRVLGPSGKPVPDATVTAARRLFGDGANAASTGGGRLGPMAGLQKSAVTDERGEFVLYGVGPRELTIVAEHERLGRSLAQVVPGGEAPATVELVLLPFAVLEGKVSRAGKPAEDVIVNVTSQRVPQANFLVTTGADGMFRFDRLAPDTYLVQATVGRNPVAGMGFHTRVVTLGPGQTARVDLDIPSGTGAIAVRVVQKGGGAVDLAMVRAAMGQVTARDAKELEAQVAALGSPSSAFAVALGGTARLSGLRAGAYSVCAVPLPNEVGVGPQAMMYVEREGERLPVFCVPASVSEGGEAEAVIEVELPRYVPMPPT